MIFTVLSAFIWPLPIFIIILYGLLMLVRKITVCCVNGIIDIFIKADDKDSTKATVKKSVDCEKEEDTKEEDTWF